MVQTNFRSLHFHPCDHGMWLLRDFYHNYWLRSDSLPIIIFYYLSRNNDDAFAMLLFCYILVIHRTLYLFDILSAVKIQLQPWSHRQRSLHSVIDITTKHNTAQHQAQVDSCCCCHLRFIAQFFNFSTMITGKPMRCIAEFNFNSQRFSHNRSNTRIILAINNHRK